MKEIIVHQGSTYTVYARATICGWTLRYVTNWSGQELRTIHRVKANTAPEAFRKAQQEVMNHV